MADIADETLVDAACAGELGAFDTLVERYQRRATSIAFRLLGNTHDALEVVQEAFVRAFRHLDALEDRRRFGPWLLRITTNLSLNFRRDRAVGGKKVSLEEYVEDEGRPRDERLAGRPITPAPDAELGASELSGVIQAEIDRLTRQQRLALVLFSIEQLPQKEVAEIMGCSVEAVKWHVFQARRKLRERLAEYL